MTSPYPYGYTRTHEIASLRSAFGDLAPGTETGTEVAVAGRVKTSRSHGKLAFADLADATGTIQLFASQQVLGDERFEAFGHLKVGDIAGVNGEVMTTRRGELSVKVAGFTLLAECKRPMPDNWHGLTDVEVRYRQRYLDLLLNESSRAPVAARALANRTIRSFLDERGFLEVETPLLQPVAGGAVARPFVTHHNALDIDLYLRVAPELYLKRLLIGGFERVYELNRSFRNEGVSTRHNPEFTMLEAYEAYADYHATMNLVEDLVVALADVVAPGHGLVKPFRRVSMFEAIAEATGADLRPAWDGEDAAGLRAEAERLGVRVDDRWSPGKLLAEVFEQTTERSLQEPTFVTGFPKDVSPLAKDHRDIPGFTEHADLVIGGNEIAPIYSELNDPDEQRRRFEQQAAARAAGDEEANVPDADFLEALAYGMPPAGGFGLGVDRLLTYLLGLHSLREVILFPTLKPER